jgi:HSP20 family protein
MAGERDLFANFERMRREIDELFGDVWSRAGLSPRQRVGFRPRVDVYYCGEPSKAIVKADLSGVDVEGLTLEVRGRVLIISGERRPRDTEGRVYQQIEIEVGPFVREIQLGTDVDAEGARATYEEGILRVELPLADTTDEPRQVPISGASDASETGS